MRKNNTQLRCQCTLRHQVQRTVQYIMVFSALASLARAQNTENNIIGAGQTALVFERGS